LWNRSKRSDIRRVPAYELPILLVVAVIVLSPAVFLSGSLLGHSPTVYTNITMTGGE